MWVRRDCFVAGHVTLVLRLTVRVSTYYSKCIQNPELQSTQYNNAGFAQGLGLFQYECLASMFRNADRDSLCCSGTRRTAVATHQIQVRLHLNAVRFPGLLHSVYSVQKVPDLRQWIVPQPYA